ncbi:MAG: NAD(P)H-dependent oxidoreductase subunit E, partial [Planctomycetota bacterium]
MPRLHSPNPCIQRLGSLKEIQSFREKLLKSYDGKKKRILVCSTGCRARNALKIRDAFYNAIKQEHLSSEIEIIETGCQGLCAYAPVVTIEPLGIFYGKLTEKDVPDIIAKTMKDKEIINNLCYSENKNTYPYRKEIPFFKPQNKIVLRNCGYINPTSPEDYIRRNGYSAIAKMLAGL